MHKHSQRLRGQRAQAMVEFALVLPIMMLVIVGILEASRLVFIYTSVINASREAARYGSAYGRNDAGFLRYQDCAAIKSAATKVGFMSGIQDSNITIQFDHGPSTTVFDTCDGSLDDQVDAHTGDRITVTVTATYTPMTPILPLQPQTFTITNSRTIIGVLEIHPEE